MKSSKPVQIQRVSFSQGSKRVKDLVATEEPLEIRLKDKSLAVMMRTPGHDEELAAGFLFTEGIVRSRGDIQAITHCRNAKAEVKDNTLFVFLSKGVRVDIKKISRHFFASSSCGICGKKSIESVHQHFKPVRDHFRVSRKVIYQLPNLLRRAQETFQRTGGLHASGLFDSKGTLVVLREDVGRHNALDKDIGFGLMRGLVPFRSHVLIVSGRVSFEIMQKALAAGIPVVAAIGAPSSLAVEFARESGQTLIGFLNKTQMNLYAHPERIVK